MESSTIPKPKSIAEALAMKDAVETYFKTYLNAEKSSNLSDDDSLRSEMEKTLFIEYPEDKETESKSTHFGTVRKIGIKKHPIDCQFKVDVSNNNYKISLEKLIQFTDKMNDVYDENERSVYFDWYREAFLSFTDEYVSSYSCVCANDTCLQFKIKTLFILFRLFDYRNLSILLKMLLIDKCGKPYSEVYSAESNLLSKIYYSSKTSNTNQLSEESKNALIRIRKDIRELCSSNVDVSTVLSSSQFGKLLDPLSEMFIKKCAELDELREKMHKNVSRQKELQSLPLKYNKRGLYDYGGSMSSAVEIETLTKEYTNLNESYKSKCYELSEIRKSIRDGRSHLDIQDAYTFYNSSDCKKTYEILNNSVMKRIDVEKEANGIADDIEKHYIDLINEQLLDDAKISSDSRSETKIKESVIIDPMTEALSKAKKELQQTQQSSQQTQSQSAPKNANEDNKNEHDKSENNKNERKKRSGKKDKRTKKPKKNKDMDVPSMLNNFANFFKSYIDVKLASAGTSIKPTKSVSAPAKQSDETKNVYEPHAHPDGILFEDLLNAEADSDLELRKHMASRRSAIENLANTTSTTTTSTISLPHQQNTSSLCNSGITSNSEFELEEKCDKNGNLTNNTVKLNRNVIPEDHDLLPDNRPVITPLSKFSRDQLRDLEEKAYYSALSYISKIHPQLSQDDDRFKSLVYNEANLRFKNAVEITEPTRIKPDA
jgi:hypothetical protein